MGRYAACVCVDICMSFYKMIDKNRFRVDSLKIAKHAREDRTFSISFVDDVKENIQSIVTVF